MDTKNLEQIEKDMGDNLLSLYSYEAEQGLYIPIFVLKTIDFVALARSKKQLTGNQFIILTKDDVLEGNDIFPLKFLHIKNHSQLQKGEDIFKNLHIDKKQLRDALEFDMRNKLIQLRESYLSFDGSKEFIHYTLPVLQKIWEGILYLSDKNTISSYEDLKNTLHNHIQVSKDFLKKIYNTDTIQDDQVDEFMQEIHRYLQEVVEEINTL